ncbi:MAG: threonine synthase [Vampirovibrio sp.]
MYTGILNQYQHLYGFQDDYPVVSLHEGNTPLIPALRLAHCLGVEGLKVYLKYEGLNPTGSFKDRGMTYAVSQAKYDGAETVVCASTGNTSAACAAYATRAKLKSLVIIPEGKIALGKLSQALMYGAQIIEIAGNFDQALNIVRMLGERDKRLAVVNSINPYRILGQQSGAWEICDALGQAPDQFFIPVGNAGNITAYWAGFKKYQDLGKIDRLPIMMGYQAEGSAPIVRGHVVEHPETVATAIRIGNPASWQGATDARDQSGGHIDMVSDADILGAYSCLARHEGVFCEPASAASVAGLMKACSEGRVQPHSTVVCLLTGHGLKDPDNAVLVGTKDVARVSLPADESAICDYLGI